MKMPEARRIVNKYNKTQEVLLEYEMLFHSAWKKGIVAASESMPDSDANNASCSH